MKNLILWLSLSSSFALPSSALACLEEVPLPEQRKKQAAVVFIGEPVAYTPSRMRKLGEGVRPALIRFNVVKMLRGPARAEYSAYWSNGTFGESASLDVFRKDFGRSMEVGLEWRPRCVTSRGTTFAGKVIVQTYCDDDFAKLGKDSKLPWIVQDACSDPYLNRQR